MRGHAGRERERAAGDVRPPSVPLRRRRHRGSLKSTWWNGSVGGMMIYDDSKGAGIDRVTSCPSTAERVRRQHARPPAFRSVQRQTSDHLGPGLFMRHWMSSYAENTRAGQRLHRRRHGLPARPAVSCLLVSSGEVALRIDVPSLVATIRQTSNQIEGASAAHAGPRRVGVVKRDCLGDPDLQAVRPGQRCTVGKPILLPVGPQTMGRPRRRTTPADVSPPDSPFGGAASAVCGYESEVARPRRDGQPPVRGNDITAGAGRDVGGGRSRCRSDTDRPLRATTR